MVSNAASLVLVAMTAALITIGAPTAIAICVRTAAWFFGRPRWIPLLALTVGAALLFLVAGEAIPYFRSSMALYTNASDSPHWPKQLVDQWFDLLLLPTSWLVGLPVVCWEAGYGCS